MLSIEPQPEETDKIEDIFPMVRDMKNVTVDYKNILYYVYKVYKVFLEEKTCISLDITCMGTQTDDLESGYRVQVGEVKKICSRLQEVE